MVNGELHRPELGTVYFGMIVITMGLVNKLRTANLKRGRDTNFEITSPRPLPLGHYSGSEITIVPNYISA